MKKYLTNWFQWLWNKQAVQNVRLTYFLDYLRENSFLGTPINDSMASLIIAQLLFLEAEDSEKDINLYINSPGGVITSGMGIYDTMQYIKPDVATICLGQAASMGAFCLLVVLRGKDLHCPIPGL